MHMFDMSLFFVHDYNRVRKDLQKITISPNVRDILQMNIEPVIELLGPRPTEEKLMHVRMSLCKGMLQISDDLSQSLYFSVYPQEKNRFNAKVCGILDS